MNREPVAIIGAVKTTIELLVVWLVIMNIWPLSPEQQAITITLVIAIVELGGTLWQRHLVTPSADPRDSDGNALVREDWR